MTISAILIFKFDIDKMVEADFFDFFGRKNLSIFPIGSSFLVPVCSIGINRYSFPPRRTHLFRVTRAIYFSISFFRKEKEKDQFLSIWDLDIDIRSRLHIPKISRFLHQKFLFRQCNGERMRERYFHFQSPIILLY